MMVRVDSPRPDLLDSLLSERFVSADKRQDLLSQGKAMKGPDGKPIFPIENAADAKNAVTLYLSGHHKTDAAKQHIIRNAKKVGADDQVERIKAGGSGD